MKIKRSNDRYLGGVCGGIAEHLKVNPYFVRIVWSIVTAVSLMLPGLVIYILLWIIMDEPEE